MERRLERVAFALLALLLVLFLAGLSEVFPSPPPEGGRPTAGPVLTPLVGRSELVGLASFYDADWEKLLRLRIRWGHLPKGFPPEPEELYAAHRTLPLGTRVRVWGPEGRFVDVVIVDRGPEPDPEGKGEWRVIDLSPEAFVRLAPLERGLVPVRLEVRP